VVHNGHLAIQAPEASVVLEFYPPDEEGRWTCRLNPMLSISFQEDEGGSIVSFTTHVPDGDFLRPRVAEDGG